MKLYIHSGIEKTGSSYLQSLCAINRNQLVSQGIWFPFAGKREKEMLKGYITAGNASDLNKYILKESYSKIERLLLKHKNEAKSRKCNSILLSNELILITFVKKNNLNEFIKRVEDLGFEINFSIFLRDWLSHTVSLYKHRAKTNFIIDIEKWVKDDYKYPEQIHDFLYNKNYDSVFKHFNLYKFDKENAIENTFFNDWLKIKVDLKIPKNVVNKSMSFSELNFNFYLRKQNTTLSELFYEYIRDNQSLNSSQVDELSQKYKTHISNTLISKAEIFKDINEKLLEFKLLYPNQLVENDDFENIYNFNENELIKLMNFILYMTSFKNFSRFHYLNCKNIFFKILRNTRK